MILPRLAILTAGLLAGCSTARLTPEIASFAGAVERSSAEVVERYRTEGIAQKFSDEYDRAVVARGAILQPDGCAGPIGFSAELDDPALVDFSRHCGLVARILDPATGDIVDVAITAADGQEGITGENARRLALALGSYAAAIRKLAESDAPKQLGASFAAAAGSVNALIGEAAKLEPGGGLDADTVRAMQSGTDLFGTLITEAFEARRYRLLQQIVTRADRSVALVSRALAGWFWLREEPGLAELYAALDDAALEQGFAVAGVGAGGDPADAVAATAELRRRHAALAAAETDARWRVFLEIAVAHRAILDSLDQPLSLEELGAANQRIIDLVRKTDAFVKAIEAVKEG